MADPKSTGPRRRTHAIGLALTRQRKELFAQLPAALAGQGEPIHQLRVACRRLRLTLAVLGPLLEERRVSRTRRSLRRLGRAAGPSRDLAVALLVLEEHLRGPVSLPPESRILLQRLRAALGRARTRMIEAVRQLDLVRLRRELGGLVAPLSRKREDLRPLIGARLREERAALAAALATQRGLDLEALHDLRRRVRRLRYLTELNDEAQGLDAGGAVRFKELQERLGVIRDTWLACSWLRRQIDRARRRGERDVARDGARQARDLGREVRRHYEAWRALPSAALLDETLCAKTPAATQPASTT